MLGHHYCKKLSTLSDNYRSTVFILALEGEGNQTGKKNKYFKNILEYIQQSELLKSFSEHRYRLSSERTKPQ